MQDYPKESGRGCFFAGLLFALVLGACGYWMLHRGTLTGSNRVQEYLTSVINARIIDPCREVVSFR